MESSLTILPQTKKLDDEIAIPIALSFRPFENAVEMNAIPNRNVSCCPKCESFITNVFFTSENKLECPFCNTQIPSAPEEQVLFSDYRI